MIAPAANPEPHQSYDTALYEALFAVEDRHFWFRARNQAIAALLRSIVKDLPAGYRVLEVGCGTGNVLRIMETECRGGRVVGMDLFGEGLQYARRRTRVPLVQGDIERPPFAEQFHIIGLFDVVEHLPDDVQAFRNLFAMLAEDGVMVLSVPAHPWLWSYFDEASHHCRRYEPADLETKLIAAGYRIEFLTPYMTCLLPLMWLTRRWTGRKARKPTAAPDRTHQLAIAELRVIPGVNEVLAFLLSQETWAIAHQHRLPWGTSLLAVARKTAHPGRVTKNRQAT